MRITFISDTHTKHDQITEDLPGGDLLIHAGDLSSMGYDTEIQNFCKWYDALDQYDTKVFIAGNHDWGFQDSAESVSQIVGSYKRIDYLQDDWLGIFEEEPFTGEDVNNMVKIYGSPWQPEFYSWAFNLPRRGPGLASKWEAIPEDTSILITHGPAWGFVDRVQGRADHLGCELLAERIVTIRPKIHVCGHIHSGHGYAFDGHTHYINASVLNERYNYANRPITCDWNPVTNEIVFL
jgi:Icc-related predicted phosphoesterase